MSTERVERFFPDEGPGTSGSGKKSEGGGRGSGILPGPLLKIWDITHPVGMSGNPACVPIFRRCASHSHRFSSASSGIYIAMRSMHKSAPINAKERFTK